MINGKTIGIDARMIEMSGIGTYIQHIMGNGIYDYALGKENEIRKYDKDVQIIPFDAKIYGLKEQFCFPNRKIKKAGIDIMHFPHYNVPISHRGKYVVTIHDLTHIVLPEFLGSRIKYYYAKFLMHNAVVRAKHIFTVSENSKKDIQRFFGTRDEIISITYNAIDDDFRLKDKYEIEYLYDRFDIPKGKKLLLYVGNLKLHKNLITLLKAMSLIDEDDIYLLLVGKAFKSIDLYDQEKTLGIEQKVIHTGVVTKDELVDLYNLADLFVFPSLYEGFGIPPLEAMACGTPVIAANNSSIPEVVGDAAIQIDATNATAIKDAIETMLASRDTQNILIAKGISRVNLFSWEDTKKTIKSVITLMC